MKKMLIFLFLVGIFASIEAEERCASTPAAPCREDACTRCYCLGPTDVIANAPLCPKTCNGDIFLELGVLYWNASQDGMEFGIETAVTVPTVNPTLSEVDELNHLVESKPLTPSISWDFGFKLRGGYCSPCDGWDLSVQWTQFHNHTSTRNEQREEDNHTLIALWSAFAPFILSNPYARCIKTDWKVELDLVDLELGRAFWVSRQASIRPFIGLRYGRLDQGFDIFYMGGTWSPRTNPTQAGFSNEVCLNQQFHGTGIHSGLDAQFFFGCGISLYGSLAGSILYGKFRIEHDESNREIVSPFEKCKLLETNESFRAARAVLDLSLGAEWRAMICKCKYDLRIRFGWEEHLFFHQNQLWTTTRAYREPIVTMLGETFNNRGQNTYRQRRGTFSTQGWTLRMLFAF